MFGRRVLIFFLNVLVFAGILVACEAGARLFETVSVSSSAPLLAKPTSDYAGLDFHPYAMYYSSPGNFSFQISAFGLPPRDTRIKTNNYGFVNPSIDFNLTKSYKKAANEKMVLFVGGSAAWGYGASTNADIVHEKISTLLNSAQSDIRYTVISLAMRGWIAQQEAVGLDLWGRLYDPDWIVTMDGSNDSTAGCRFSQGTGNPTLTPIMRIQLRPDYFNAINRNGSEERLIETSALYRALTGKRPVKTAGRRYITDEIFFDPSMQMGEFAFTTTPFSEVKNQLEFYLLAEKSMIDRFPKAKYLLTTEARAEPFKSMFGDYFATEAARSEQAMREEKFAAVMDAWLRGSEAIGRECSYKNGTVAQRYILEMGALRLKQLVEQTASTGRPDVEYFNMGRLFPLPLEQRRNFFIDDVHLNDAGHDRAARYYAYRILARDFPNRDWTSLRPEEYRSDAK